MRQIKLSQHRKIKNYTLQLVALVDDLDFEKLNQYKWYALNCKGIFYARTAIPFEGKQKILIMHRLILDAPKDMMVDHRDGNGLNNQRSNIRLCTRGQNKMNQNTRSGSSQFKGVTWNKRAKKWRAFITVDSKLMYLGSFKSEVAAAKKYDIKAKDLHGDFANLNFKS